MSKERGSKYHPYIDELEATSQAFERCMGELGEPEILGWHLDSGNLFWLWGEAVTAMVNHYQPLLDAKDAEIARMDVIIGEMQPIEAMITLREQNTTLKALLERAREGLEFIVNHYSDNQKLRQTHVPMRQKARELLTAINAATGKGE